MTILSPVISVNNMSVVVNQNRLLNKVEMSILPGTWLGIIGANGGGKSTLLKALLGHMPYEGSIAYTWPNATPGRVGYVPQIASFESSLPITVTDYLRIVSESKPVWFKFKKNDHVEALMKKLVISDFHDKRIGTLSTGERQRVLLCGALINNPDILLLDEPLAGVDKSGHQLILDLLVDFHSNGKTIIMIEHHWHVLKEYCQQIAMIEGGVKELGSPEQVFANLEQSFISSSLAKIA